MAPPEGVTEEETSQTYYVIKVILKTNEYQTEEYSVVFLFC